MINQIIDGTKLKSIFDNWLNEENHEKLDPLTEVETISKSLSLKFAKSFSSEELNSIRMLAEGGINWLIFKGVCQGIDKINIDTPTDFPPIQHSNLWWPVAQVTIGLLSACKFRPISYKSENDGALFQNLVAGNSQKSKGRLRGHTDAVAFPFQLREVSGHKISSSPNFVVLSGIRNPNRVPTWLAPAQKIYSKIDKVRPGASNKLFEKCFDIEPQPSFDTNKLPPNYKLIDECLREFDQLGHPLMRFKNSGIDISSSIDKHEKDIYVEVLREITRALEDDLNRQEKEIFEEVIVEPGDILIVNNRCALHGRGKVTNSNDSKDIGGLSRWLLRTYGYKLDTHGIADPDLSHCMLP